MDVSSAADLLFEGVVPERVAEMQGYWKAADPDRVRLLEASRFLIQASYGSIQVSEKALRLIWLTGYCGWAAVEAYSDRIKERRESGALFDPVLWNSDPHQQVLDAQFDALFLKVREMEGAGSIEDVDWPQAVPKPVVGLKINDPAKKATFDLICMAGAFVFAHELRHALLDQTGSRPTTPIAEERECDQWAVALMLDQAADYASESGQDATSVRAKRLMGMFVAQLVILVMTPRENWGETEDYPSVRERLGFVFDAAVDPVPEWFWHAVASILTGFCRAFNVLPDPQAFPATDQELAYLLRDTLRSA